MVRIIISLGGTMTDSYPFTVFGGEFKGKRVLVTGGTKGIGEANRRSEQSLSDNREDFPRLSAVKGLRKAPPCVALLSQVRELWGLAELFAFHRQLERLPENLRGTIDRAWLCTLG